jgi:dTMP kinase
MTGSGVFIVFEGGDGVGKSTQIDLLAVWLRSAVGGNHKVLTTREPGGTPLGQELRLAVMHGDHVAPRAEALLYAADRAHHVATVVRPALDLGAVILQDRYIDSSIVYQGGARGLGREVERISTWATEGLLPHLTVLLDMEPAPERMSRDLDRVERETSERAVQMRAEYLTLAARAPDRYAIINAAQSIEMVHREVRSVVSDVIARGGPAPHASIDDQEPGMPVVPHKERRHR